MAAINYAVTPFKYNPSVAAASIFLGLFAITTSYHVYQIGRSKSWYLGAIAFCGIFELVGYSSRLASRQDPFNISLYSAQYAFLILAPIFLAASIYVMLGRIIRFVDYPALISAKRVAFIFVGCDIVSFFVQVIGAIILLNRNKANNVTLGKNILLVGLIIQIATFAFFTAIAIHFDIVVAKSGRQGGKWRWLMKALYMACGLVLVRSIYRVIEFSGSTTSYLQTTEWPIYVFDADLIFIVMVIFNVIHPTKYLITDVAIPKTNSLFANKIGVNGTPAVLPNVETNQQV